MNWIWRKIYIQVHQSSFSPNSAVVTRPDSGWLGPGSNPWSMYKKIIKLTEHHKEIVRNVIAVGKMQRKKREKTLFSGAKQGVTGRGRYRGCYKSVVTVTGVSWAEISIGPLRRGKANLHCNVPVMFLYWSCNVGTLQEHYRSNTGSIQWMPTE